jgi:glycosyltransferase involved in cell wall biosynthesis
MISVAPIRATATSASWSAPATLVSVVISTHNRADLLDGLLDALEAQQLSDFEVVVADNGSGDDTWDRLVARCERTSLTLIAIRLDPHDGPGIPRNTAVGLTRTELVAFTDDDCLPQPEWLSGLVAGFETAGTAVVQGRTEPEPGGWAGPWGRTVEVNRFSGLYETANLAVRRSAFDRVGGFEAERRLTGRAFGEDVVLGAAIARTGTARFASEAVVWHRVMPARYRDLLTERLRLRGFPDLINDVPELEGRMVGGVFLSDHTRRVDVGVAGLAVVVVTRRSLPLLVAAPWLLRTWRESDGRPGRPRVVRALQLLVADLVGLGALTAGSIRSRRTVL